MPRGMAAAIVRGLERLLDDWSERRPRVHLPRAERLSPVEDAFRRGWQGGLFRALQNVQDQMTAIRSESVKRAEAYRDALVAAEAAGEAARACKWCKHPEGAHVAKDDLDRRMCRAAMPDGEPAYYEPTAPEPAYVPPTPPEPLKLELGLDELRLMLERLLRDPPAESATR